MGQRPWERGVGFGMLLGGGMVALVALGIHSRTSLVSTAVLGTVGSEHRPVR